MDFKEAASLSSDDIIKSLNSANGGLSNSEVQKRLDEYGQNNIASKQVTAWDIFRRQFKSPFVYLLFGASALSLILGEKIDSLMILLFVAINTALGFYQEYKSEQTVKLLKKYLVSKIRVLRDGREENLETAGLVPGDVVLLEPGDIIPADLRFINDYNLTVDETVLTGESIQIQKTSQASQGKVAEIYDAKNIGFSGTTVVEGNATGIIFATGEGTNYAQIVKLAGETEKESSFEKEITKFSKFTLWVVLATLIFIIVTSVAVKESPSFTDLILFSIALAVSVIPEALPVVTTFSLSIGAFNLTKKKVVVKRLTSVEDLGALQVLATDKTGTLTLNKLEVANVNSRKPEVTLLYSTLASYFIDTSRNTQSSAFDIAFWNTLGIKEKNDLKNYKKIADIPFDPGRKRVTVLLEYKGKYILISRGSPEEIAKLSKGKGIEREVMGWVAAEGREGRRSLAVAYKLIKGAKYDAADLTKAEKEMTFLGAVSFTDPIKPSTYKAIEKAKALGVQVKIITGDSPEVAGAVAQEIKLIKTSENVITGAEFKNLDADEKHDAIAKYNVFARIVPEQKHEIITLLKEIYYVGFLGEGINDAPALKASNVAVVVEGASDIAKEASDIVLLEKDLGVIIEGIEEGRRVFANTSKYITSTMASNFGNFFAVALIAPFINFLPMLPLQILLVNLLSDFPMISVATDNVDPEEIRTSKRYNLKNFAVSAISFGFISTAFDFAIFRAFYPLGEKSLQTYWFIESIFSELLFLFTIRTLKPFYKASPPSKPLIYLTIFTILITIAIPYSDIGRNIFGFVRPEFPLILTVIGIVIVYLIANEAVKSIINKYAGKSLNTKND